MYGNGSGTVMFDGYFRRFWNVKSRNKYVWETLSWYTVHQLDSNVININSTHLSADVVLREAVLGAICSVSGARRGALGGWGKPGPPQVQLAGPFGPFFLAAALVAHGHRRHRSYHPSGNKKTINTPSSSPRTSFAHDISTIINIRAQCICSELYLHTWCICVIKKTYETLKVGIV